MRLAPLVADGSAASSPLAVLAEGRLAVGLRCRRVSEELDASRADNDVANALRGFAQQEYIFSTRAMFLLVGGWASTLKGLPDRNAMRESLVSIMRILAGDRLRSFPRRHSRPRRRLSIASAAAWQEVCLVLTFDC